MVGGQDLSCDARAGLDHAGHVAAVAVVPPDAHVTLLHVAPGDVEHIAGRARHGLLGRSRRAPPGPPIREITDAAAAALLDEARERLGRDATCEQRRGRIEREVLDAARGADLLVLSRDCPPPAPRPAQPRPRHGFVVDHVPSDILLVWPPGPMP
jgi:hypothetical protein